MEFKFKRGDKVKLPKQKTVGTDLENSSEYKKAIKNNQDYMYITNVHMVSDCYVVAHKFYIDSYGDFFAEEDLELHEEGKVRDRGFEKISYEQYCKDVGGDVDLSQEYTDIKLPRRATKKSSGYDFYSVCDFQLSPGEEIKLPTGIKVYMQDDEELLLFPRSSVGFKYNVKINNTIGKIDSDYYNNKSNEGHIWVKFTNTGNKVWEVKKGEAIMQGTFYKYLIVDNDNPVKKERTGGIGSTN